MPLYDYACENCDFVMPDVDQRITDEPLQMECPSCRGSMRRRIGQTSFVLRGGGWAKQGYSSSKKTK